MRIGMIGLGRMSSNMVRRLSAVNPPALLNVPTSRFPTIVRWAMVTWCYRGRFVLWPVWRR